jgi:hypothetical protein
MFFAGKMAHSSSSVISAIVTWPLVFEESQFKSSHDCSQILLLQLGQNIEKRMVGLIQIHFHCIDTSASCCTSNNEQDLISITPSPYCTSHDIDIGLSVEGEHYNGLSQMASVMILYYSCQIVFMYLLLLCLF